MKLATKKLFEQLNKKYKLKNNLIKLSDIKQSSSDIILDDLDKKLNSNNHIIKEHKNKEMVLKTHYLTLDKAIYKKQMYITIIKLIITYLLLVYLLNNFGDRFNIGLETQTIFFYAISLYFIGIIYINLLVIDK